MYFNTAYYNTLKTFGNYQVNEFISEFEWYFLFIIAQESNTPFILISGHECY